MNSWPAVRYVAAQPACGCIQILCHVRPGASKQREGITSVSEAVVEVCVSARPVDGASNKAVRAVFSNVLKCPKSDVAIIKGLKSRDKTIAVAGFNVGKEGEANCISKIRSQLENAVP